ncbi:alpha/beta family hydrolase [Solicola sp. PLA-1-18]|uniref:alpha/beta hydrolase family protein n=1 Tax=Solicola sp. PLA-1-18 TaxID=3380532 RepID=UPI003B7AF2EE
MPTPHGPGRLVTHRSPRPRANLALTHGAGGGIDARDLAALATGLVHHDVTVVLVEMPWVGAGRGIAPAPAVLDECFVAMLDRTRPRVPLVAGGRSAGARVACRTGRRVGAVGVLALAFPLHPPGKPEKSRADELDTGLPLRVLQGGRDPFGAPVEMPVGLGVDAIEGADHGFKVRRSDPLDQSAVLDLLVEKAAAFVARVTPPRR